MVILCKGGGEGRFPEGAFLSLRVSRADEALGHSAATILKPEGLSMPRTIACEARSKD